MSILELRERRWAGAQKNSNEMALFAVTGVDGKLLVFGFCCAWGYKWSTELF